MKSMISIDFNGFPKLAISSRFWNSESFENNRELNIVGAPALRDIRAETRLTVYRALPIEYRSFD